MKAAIIGGGVIGGGWAARFILNGWDVAIVDPAPDAARKVEAILESARRCLPRLYEKTGLPAEGRFIFTSLAEALQDADWIQESLPEKLEIKRAMYAEIEKRGAKDTVIGSSTSYLAPSLLQEGRKYPERFLVTHPFNPVYLLPLVEVVPSPHTKPAAIDLATCIMTKIGMKPLAMKREIDGFIANRLQEAIWREALWMVKDGFATTKEVDDAVRYSFGLRYAIMGPFDTCRMAGGEGGFAHFLSQFGPYLEAPFSKLMDVPTLDDALVKTISDQSDAQSGHLTIHEMERIRDDNLVAILKVVNFMGKD